MADYTFTQTGPEIQQILDDSSSLNLNAARIDTENTFSETQTFDKPILNSVVGIKHNSLSFIAKCRGTSTAPSIDYAPAGVTITRTGIGMYEIDCSAITGAVGVFCTANIRTSSPLFSVNVLGTLTGIINIYPINNGSATDFNVDVNVNVPF